MNPYAAVPDYCRQNRPVFDRRLQMSRGGNSYVDYYSQKYRRYGPTRGRCGNSRGFGSNYRGRGGINEGSCTKVYMSKKRRRIHARDPKWTSITYNVSGSSKSETLFLMDIEEESINPQSFNLDEEKETESAPEIIGNEQLNTDVLKQVEEKMEMSTNNNKCVSPPLDDMRTNTESQQYSQNAGVKEGGERLPPQVAYVFSCYGNDFITPEDNNQLSDDKSEIKTTNFEDKPNIDHMTQEELFALGKKVEQVIRDTSPSSISRLLPNILPNKEEISTNKVDISSSNDGIVKNINDLPQKTDSEITTPQLQNRDEIEDSSEDEVFRKQYKRIKRRSRLEERAPLNECTNKTVKIIMEKLPDTTITYWRAKMDHNRNLSSDVCTIKPKGESKGSKTEKPSRWEKQHKEIITDNRKHVPPFAVREGVRTRSKTIKEKSSLEHRIETASRQLEVSDLLDEALENSESWKALKAKDTADALSTKKPRGARNKTKSSCPVKSKIRLPKTGKPSDTKCKPKESKKSIKEYESHNSDKMPNSISDKRKYSETENIPRLENKMEVTSPKLCEKKSKENLDLAIIKKTKTLNGTELEKNGKNGHKRMPENAMTIEKEISANGKTVNKKATGTEKHQEKECATPNKKQKLQGANKSDRNKMSIAKNKHEAHFAENYLHKKIRRSYKFAPVRCNVTEPHHFHYLLEDFENFQKLEDGVVRVEVVASGVASASQIPAESSAHYEEIVETETKENVAEDIATEVAPSAVENVGEIERPSSVASLPSTVDLHPGELAEQQIFSSDDRRDVPDLNALYFDESSYATKDVCSSTGENPEGVVLSQREENLQEDASVIVEYLQQVDASLEKSQGDVVSSSIVNYLQEVAATFMEYQEDDAPSIEEFQQEGKSGESREEVALSARTTQQEIDVITGDSQQTVAIATEYQQEVPTATGENQLDVAICSEENRQEASACTWNNQPTVAAFNGEYQQEVALAASENQQGVSVSAEENRKKGDLSSEVKQQVTASLAVKSLEQVPSLIADCSQGNTVNIQQNIIICPPKVQPETLPDTRKTQPPVVSKLPDTPAEVDWPILFTETYNPSVINHTVDKDLARRLCVCYGAFLQIEMIYNRQLFENASGIPKGIRTTALDYRMHLQQNANTFEQLLLKCSSEDTLEEFLQMVWHSFRGENMCVYICCLIRLLQDVKCCSPWLIYLLNRLSILFYINPEAFINMMDIKFKQIDVTKRETLLHHLTLRCKKVYAEKVRLGTSDEHKDHILRSSLLRDGTNVREGNMEFLMKFTTKKVRSTDAIMQDWLNWNSTNPKIVVKCPATLTGVMSVKPSIARTPLPQDNKRGDVISHRVTANQSPAQPTKADKQKQPKPATSQLAKQSQCQLCPPAGLNSQYQQQSNGSYMENELQQGANTASAPPVQQQFQPMSYVGNATTTPLPVPLESMTAVNSQHQQRQNGVNTENASALKDQPHLQSLAAMLNSNMPYKSTQRSQYHHSGVSQSGPQYMPYSYPTTGGQVPLSYMYGYQQQCAYFAEYQQPVGFNAAVHSNMQQRPQTVNYATQRVPYQHQAAYNVPSTPASTEHHQQRKESQIGSTNKTYRPPPLPSQLPPISQTPANGAYTPLLPQLPPVSQTPANRAYPSLLPQLPPISQTPANGDYTPQILQRHSNHRSDFSMTGADFNTRTQQTPMAYTPQHVASLPSMAQTARPERVPVPRPRNGSISSATMPELPCRSPLQRPKQLEQKVLPGTQRPCSNQRSLSNSSSEHVVGQIPPQVLSDCSNASTTSSSAPRRNSTEELDMVKFHYTKLLELVSKIKSDGGTIPKEVQGMVAGNSRSISFTDTEIQVLKGMIAKHSANVNEIIVIKDEDDSKVEVLDSD